MKEEIDKLRKENEYLRKLNKEHEIERAKQFAELKSLKVMTKKNINDKVIEVLSKIFTEGQVQALLSKQKRASWTTEDISAAISLRNVSAKAYRYMRSKLHYPLPALSTLRNWISQFDSSPDILHNIIGIVKYYSRNLKDFQKIVAPSFDETSLHKEICFDRRKEKILGPLNNVQVVMARGITGKWKQPIYYSYDTAMNKDLLFQIINSIETAGFNVVSVTSDLGPGNRALWKQLNISPNNVSFCNPFDPERPVFVFADVPHLLKLPRNTASFIEGRRTECGNIAYTTCWGPMPRRCCLLKLE